MRKPSFAPNFWQLKINELNAELAAAYEREEKLRRALDELLLLLPAENRPTEHGSAQ